MPILMSLVPITFMTVFFAGYIKLSAKILRTTTLSWKHAFIYSLIVVALTLVGRVGVAFFGAALPLPLGLILGLMLHLGLGGWFFSTRGTNAEGLPIGWRGGMQLSGIFFCLLGLTVAILIGFHFATN